MTQPNLSLIAETTEFRRTGRFEEVERLCAAFARRWPEFVRCIEFGRTPEGRTMLALVISGSGTLDAARMHERGIPILMWQACIHPGECDGKDAGFIVLRELLGAAAAAQALASLAILFVPVFSVDGHERFGRWNRINQTGPEEMGWRATAQNLNLNRDYTKTDAPEMQAMLRLMQEWDPLLCADFHVSDGANFEHDVSVQVEPIHYGSPELFATGREIRSGLIDYLASAGSLPLHFYYSLVDPNDPASGFADWLYSPRFSTGYWPLRNRFTVLIETHSWKDYATRVRISRHIMVRLIELIHAHGAQRLAKVGQVDAAETRAAATEVPVQYRISNESTIIDFRGFRYARTPSEVSGVLRTSYDPQQPQLWRVPLRDAVDVALAIRSPGRVMWCPRPTRT